MGFLGEWLTAIGVVLAQSGPYLLAGFVIAGLLKVLLPEKLVYRHLGGDDLRSVTIASLFGVPIPLCSCSVLPSAVALRRAGASKGATTSFLISTPETGVDSIGVTWALMDPLMTVARPVAAFLTAILSGSAVNLLVRRGRDDAPAPGAAGPDACGCADEGAPAAGHAHDHDPAPAPGVLGALRAAVHYGFGPLMADLTPSFLVGFALSGLILALVPQDFIGQALPPGLPTMLLMLVVGAPVYICATASTPVAAALVAKGLDPSAALVLLLAGPATNVATMVVVKDFLGKRVLVVYLASIALASLALGAVVGELYGALGIDARAVAERVAEAGPGPVAVLSAVVLGAALVHHARRLQLAALWGARLRAVCAPLGFDPTSRLARAALLAAALLAWASTTASTVAPGEVGFRLRFGRVVSVHEEPGIVLHAPAPFERLERVDAARVRELEFGFDSRADERGELASGEPLFGRDLAGEAELVTGDENLLRVNWTLHWSVADARRFRFGLQDAEALLRGLAESALRRVVARRPIDALLLGRRGPLQDRVAARLQRELDALDSGLAVTAVQLVDVHAPPQVHEAYRDVASALEDKERQERRAERYAAELRAQARARAFAVEEQAEAERVAAVERASGEARAFLDMLAAEREAPALTRLRLRREATERALAAARLVLVLAPGVEVVPIQGRALAPGGPDAAPGGTPRVQPAPWEDQDR